MKATRNEHWESRVTVAVDPRSGEAVYSHDAGDFRRRPRHDKHFALWVLNGETYEDRIESLHRTLASAERAASRWLRTAPPGSIADIGDVVSEREANPVKRPRSGGTFGFDGGEVKTWMRSRGWDFGEGAMFPTHHELVQRGRSAWYKPQSGEAVLGWDPKLRRPWKRITWTQRDAGGEVVVRGADHLTGASHERRVAAGDAIGAVVALVDELDSGELPRSVRRSALEQVWATTHRDYRDADEDGTRWVVMLTELGTQLLRLDELDDAQLRRKLGAVSRLALR